MWAYYLIALIPVVVWMVLWIRSKEIVWWEWAASAAIGFFISAITHAIIVAGMTADTETWSGQVTHAVHHPKWIEEYQEMHTRTVGSGKNQTTEVYWTTEHRTHHEHWTAYLDFGSETSEEEIDKNMFERLLCQWGGETRAVPGRRPGFDGGDKNDYHTLNKTGYIHPAVTVKQFENRVKASPSVFSYVKVPDTAPVFEWPKPSSWDKSGRLLGTAPNAINEYQFDLMNTRLGPVHKVNVIMIGFGDLGSEVAQLQEAKWIGGKKNDLVLCYGGTSPRPTWAYVFGWTEQEVVKRNLESILMSHKIDTDILSLVEKEIRNGYVLKDWSKFDYLTVDPPWWAILILLVIMGGTQTVCYLVAHNNEFSKDGSRPARAPFRPRFGLRRLGR